jgi:O-antigen/teichoic acid export membrane protein
MTGQHRKSLADAPHSDAPHAEPLHAAGRGRQRPLTGLLTRLWRLSSGRLGRNTLSGIYAQVVQLVIQVISVPVLVQHWGLAGYGVWVLLFTVPQMLSMADLGIGTAGGNAMQAATARGESGRALRIYATLRCTSAAAALIISAIVALYLFALAPHALDFAQPATGGHAALVVMMVLAYAGLAMQNQTTASAYRTHDLLATWQMAYDTGLLIEALLALGVAARGGGPAMVAGVYLAARLVLSTTLALWLLWRVPVMARAPLLPDWQELQALFRPAIAALMLPGAQAITLQGSVMALGAIGGPAALPAFTTIRTLSRTALMFTYRFSWGSAPRYIVHHARGEDDAAERLAWANILVPAVLLLPAAPLLYLLGPGIIRIWTHGVVHASPSLLALMLAAMVLNGAWVPLSNLLCAINEHARFSYVFLAVSALTIPLGAGLARPWGADGMAWALVVQELVMGFVVWRIVLHCGMLHPSRCIAICSGFLARWR